MFVAHPNVQQLLSAIWYEGVPGFRRKKILWQIVHIVKLFIMFPIYCLVYIIAPSSRMGRFMKKPFVKFICHSASYILFLTFVSMASQRLEIVILELIGTDWLKEKVNEWKKKERGAFFGFAESIVILFVSSLVWAEIKSLWTIGLKKYISDLWNIIDFIVNVLYILWFALRMSSWYIVRVSWGTI
ncbi:hypothetical protein ILUMI_14733 [Ignelater luminosus]|uniref:Ion transport domain-containing protein n=1 Tax=Ignelater luminosus TaxID=2038154 RepID=A0A8K0CPZ7_IGNLU|nr:hypothetical protein ILUMI_14733 [Ignelater luminosus]